MTKNTIPLHAKTQDLGILPPHIRRSRVTITFMVSEFNAAIPLDCFNDVVVLGRLDPAMPDYPDVNFSPYRAYELGVSRRHAAVRLSGETILVKDLGSVNGTYVNGQRLAPGQHCPLKDGDELRLGKLVLRVRLTR